jgi:polysaccharide biosynthesis/export protein
MSASRLEPMMIRYVRTLVALGTCLSVLAGCSTYSPFLPSAGPSAQQISDSPAQPDLGIQVVELSPAVVQRIVAAQPRASFAEAFGKGVRPNVAIGEGDSLEISVWEAPPAALFGGAVLDTRGAIATSRVTVLPEQMVSSAGTINMPFVGAVGAAGRTPQEIEAEIARRLKGKANDPQVLVRVLRNASSNVTVVGEVKTSTRMPLTSRGERLLDALAAAGGLSQAVGKVTVQLTREAVQQGSRVTKVASLPLDTVITDPSQNVILQPGDVVTALFQPNSFTVLGATARNEEINFEAQGITLAQALARAGGLQDQRANAAGVFIFRFEDPTVLGGPAPSRTTVDGKVPVVYRADLKDPASFFAAQGFPMRNKDVMYVANAPGSELQKFLTIISSVVVPAVTLRSVSPN